MKKNKTKVVMAILIVVSIVCIMGNTNAHSGRTDSNGGHKDNKNASGLGSYHYHCGGNPPHLHTKGACPYAPSNDKSSTSSSSSSSKSTTSSSSSSKKSTTTETSAPTSAVQTTETTSSVIEVIEIRINEKIEELEVGKKIKLTATITPSDATNKEIEWKSSDESMVTISTTGEIIAKKAGNVEITVSTLNGKTDKIKIKVTEKLKEENKLLLNTKGTNGNTINNEGVTDNTLKVNPIAVILTLGVLGGAGYWGYKKYKINVGE